MKTNDKVREECGVFGVSLITEDAHGVTYNGLLALQHRGQESSGIAVAVDNKIFHQKNIGLVGEVFSDEVMKKLPKSYVAIGHNRYSTTGGNVRANAGPFVSEFLTGRIAVAHNGNVTNASEIKKMLLSYGLHFVSGSDSEVVASLIAYRAMLCGDNLEGIKTAALELKGAFSLVILCNDNRLIALRDRDGYRPLCIGKNENGIAIASESCALDSCDFSFLSDVEPGEMVVVENAMISQRTKLTKKTASKSGLCIFEYVYFARPDSTVDGMNVYKARYNMGSTLAVEHPVEADVVCGVPDSGLEAAIGYSAASKIPLVSGFVKNRYIGRSFIYPTQSHREGAVKLKLNPLASNVMGKRVVLVDDSIVRGTTIGRIVKSLRNAGASEVHLRISSPPFKYSCHYGTDVDDESALIANKMDSQSICSSIGADSLGYISVDGLKSACSDCVLGFCSNCFTGDNSVENVTKNMLEDSGDE